jgi:hypothetical protein
MLLKKILAVNRGKITCEIPSSFGQQVKVIILPANREDSTDSTEKGLWDYADEWTEEEWQRFSLNSFMNTEDDRNVDWEDFFSVKNR